MLCSFLFEPVDVGERAAGPQDEGQTRSMPLWLHLAVVVAASFLVARGYWFHLAPGDTRCYSEEIPPGVDVLCEYSVAQAPGGPHVTFTLRQDGAEVFRRGPTEDGGKHSLTTSAFGEHSIELCFTNSGPRSGIARKVHFAVRLGQGRNVYHHLAKEEHLASLEASFRDAYSRIAQVVREIDAARRREDELERNAVQTGSVVFWGMVVSLLAIACSTIAQLLYTRTKVTHVSDFTRIH